MLAAIRVRLILLTLIVAIPLIAANLFVINRLASEQSEAQKQTLIATTRALAAAVDAELKKYAVVGRSLGTSVPLEERNFERFHRQALEASAPLPGAWVVVADVQGQQLVNTLRVFGEKLPMVVPLEVHRRALQTGIEQIGGVLVGPVVQRPALGVFVPVFKGGKAEFNIVIGLDPRVFTRVLENQRLPEGWVAGIGDPQGNFVARSIENDRYVGKPISSGWLAASRSESEGHVENISQEGIPLSSAFSNLTSSGWTVSVGASKEVLNSPVRKSLWIVAAVSSALVALSLALSWFAGRSITRSMESLENASSSLLSNDPINLRRTGLREVDHALTAFERAAASIFEREKQHSLLVGELNHRVKNTLAVVQSMAVLAKQTATSVSSFSASFVSRIVSLARTHDLLTESNWDTVQLKGIFENELTAYQNSDCTRISLSGSLIALNSKEAVAISMIVHELATNAAKHGALSKVDGRLRISWKESDQTITIDWEEENGPPIGGPQSSNFGTKLIRNLATSLSGEATIEFLPSGARFALNFPKSSAGSHRSQANGGSRSTPAT